MFVPAPPVQASPALAPVAVVGTAQVTLAQASVRTTLAIRKSQLNVLDGQPAIVAGALLDGRRPGQAGLVVTLQTRAGRGWRNIAKTHTRAGGRFQIRLVTRHVGTEPLRVQFAGDATALPSHRAAGELNVYRLALASWYGGGGTMACGGQLSSGTLGVANKTLPCGTLVTLRYGSRTIRVPVVDRGPYVEGREFDLTEATKEALGFGGVGQVWSTS
jgi:hypothetical protein